MVRKRTLRWRCQHAEAHLRPKRPPSFILPRVPGGKRWDVFGMTK